MTKLSALFGASLLCAFGPRIAANESPVAFAHDIRPILEKNCFGCHGEKKQKAGLRFDSKASILKPTDNGKAVVIAGKSAESELIRRVTSADGDVKMPPEGDKLSDAQIALLKTWIDSGAAIPDDASTSGVKHWAYVKPVAKPLPEVKDNNWCRNGLDAFVLARLEKEGLKPSPEADKAALLRRVSLDLTGLSPSLEERDAFMKDAAPDAYEKAVERLLASPAYGERWARPWLDLARYADTQGYEKDNRRSMWPYRDWVVNAFNRDLPFDQFTIEQIAGDMLPNATLDQKIATGFHRNTMTNTEGGTDDEEFRYEAVVDRVNTTFGVWMGTTLNCAQCHNHKYDPFLTREYYSVMAFLNNTEDSDKDDERPTMKVFGPGQKEKLETLRETETAAAKKLDDATAAPAFAAALAEWETRARASTPWTPLIPHEIKSEGGAKLAKTADGTVQASGHSPNQDTYVFETKIKQKSIAAFRLEALPDKAFPGMGPGRSDGGNFILSEFKLTVDGKPLAFSGAKADFQQDGWAVAGAIDAKPETGWAIAPESGKAHQAVFTLPAPINKDGAEIVVNIRLEFQHPQWAKHVLGKFRIYSTDDPNAQPTETVPDDVRKILDVAADKRSGAQRTRLRDLFRDLDASLKPQREALAAAKKAVADFEKSLPITSVMVELPTPRVTKRHVRGAYLNTAEEVQPATPAALHPFPKDQPLNRLGFARWLVDRENPLTARVIVNRFWEQYFGKGIVETVEEFGKQGETPSNQDLLDWLAVQFMNGPVPQASRPPESKNQPWSMKAFHRLIVTSATYRQSSKVTQELREKDPFNRLFARGPRVRLEAEMIRDQALAVSGLLSHKMGGPSVMPPQPDGLWQMVYSGDQWKTSPGEDKYRRGLYTFWRRTSPHPMMVSFDAPSREFCVLRRNRSDTPLQALNIMNDPEFIECAQALARKINAAPGDTIAKAAFALRTCLIREPRPGEAERLGKLFDSESAHYAKDLPAAEKMATSELGKQKENANVAELAAWTVVANVILNLDETITK